MRFHGASMVLPWCLSRIFIDSHGGSMHRFQGDFVVLSWTPMVLLWCSRVRPWCFHGEDDDLLMNEMAATAP